MKASGFTLLELLVGIVLAGIAVSLVVGIHTTTTETLGRLSALSGLWERRAQARVWLAQSLAGARVSSDPGSDFSGTADRMEFRSSIWVPEGWLEDARVEVLADSAALRLRIEGQPAIELLDSVGSIVIDYRADLGSASGWVERWHSFASPPLAVRLRYLDMRSRRSDTILVFVGARG